MICCIQRFKFICYNFLYIEISSSEIIPMKLKEKKLSAQTFNSIKTKKSLSNCHDRFSKKYCMLKSASNTV